MTSRLSISLAQVLPSQVLPFKGLICFYCHPCVSRGKAPINAAVCTHWLPEVTSTWRVSDLSPHYSAGGSLSCPPCPGRGLVPQGLAWQEAEVKPARR